MASRPAEVRDAFDIARNLRHGWEALTRQPLGLLLGSFIVRMTGGGTGGGGGNIGGGNGGSWSGGDLGGGSAGDVFDDAEVWIEAIGIGVALGVFGFFMCCAIGLWVFRSWILVGYHRLQGEVLIDGEGAVGTLFSGGDGLVRMLLWSLLSGIIGLGVAVVAATPGGALVAWGVLQDGAPDLFLVGLGAAVIVALATPAAIYINLGLSLGSRAVALDHMSAFEALERSWELADGNRFHLLLFFVITWLPNLLGCMMFCIGIVVTDAIRSTAVTEGYLLCTRDGSDFACLKHDIA